MTQRITADFTVLMDQASATANEYLNRSIRALDKIGKPYTITDAIALAGIAARDYQATMMVVAAQIRAEE